MTLTKEEWEEMRAIGDSLDTSWGAMDQELFDDASERYDELQKKMHEPEPDITLLDIRRPGDIRPVG